MDLTFWVFLAVVVIGILVVVIGGRKKRWYTIYLANNDIAHGFRTMFDWWWNDSTGIMGFRLPDGRKLKVSKHWILKVEEDQKGDK